MSKDNQLDISRVPDEPYDLAEMVERSRPTRTVAEVVSAIVAVVEDQLFRDFPEAIRVDEATTAQVESLLQEWSDSLRDRAEAFGSIDPATLTAPPSPVRIAAGEASRNTDPATEPAARIGAQRLTIEMIEAVAEDLEPQPNWGEGLEMFAARAGGTAILKQFVAEVRRRLEVAS